MRITVLFALAVATAPFAPAAADEEPAATVAVKLLAPELAAQAVGAALRDCRGRGYQVAASLVSRDGTLLAMLRDPLAGAMTVDISRGKAYAVASFRVSSSELAAMDDADGLRFADGVIFAQGGVPIEVAGSFYGGIGVSGATGEADEECAAAGVAAIAETLEFAE